MRQTSRVFEAFVVAAVSIGLSGVALAQSTPVRQGGSMLLPVPEQAFGGVIGRKASESKPDFPKAVRLPRVLPIFF